MSLTQPMQRMLREFAADLPVSVVLQGKRNGSRTLGALTERGLVETVPLGFYTDFRVTQAGRDVAWAALTSRD